MIDKILLCMGVVIALLGVILWLYFKFVMVKM